MEKTKNSTGKCNGSRRWFIISAALVLVIAVVCVGGLWLHQYSVQEHERAFGSYKAATKFYKVQEGEYRRYLASDEVKSASATKDGQVGDVKIVQVTAESIQTKPSSRPSARRVV